MNPERRRTVLRFAFALVLSLGAPLAVLLLLRPDGPVVPVLIASPALAAVSFFRRGLKPAAARVIGFLAGLFCGFVALALVMYIILIPFAYYLAWLNLVRDGRPGGLISFLFFAVTALFSGVLAGAVGRAGWLRPAAGLALVLVFEALVIWQSAGLAALFTVLAALTVLLLALSTPAPAPRRLILPAVVLTVAVAFSLVFSSISPPHSGALVRTGFLSGIKRIITTVFPDLSALSSPAGYGYSFDREDLGRKPLLSSVPLLRVGTPPGNRRRDVVYLRTQIFDEYFNGYWGVSRSLLDRMERPTPEIRAGAYARGSSGDIELSVLFEFLPMLPHTLDTRAVFLPTRTRPSVAGGGIDTGYDLSLPLVKGDAVILELNQPAHRASAPVVVFSSGGFSENAVNERPEPADGWDAERREGYLLVPTTISAKARALATALSAGPEAPGATVDNIIRRLNRDYVYTLDTVPPPPGKEFVDDFLFVTRRGYCEHFATAFVMLARCNNIPARYATGFLVFMRAGQPGAVVTGYNAHAWPEVWLPASGWVTVEATPPFDTGNAGAPDFYRAFNPGNDRLTDRQLKAFLGGVIPADDKARSGPAGFFDAVLPVIPWVLGSLGAAALVVVGCRAVRRRRGKKRVYRGDLRRFNRVLCLLVERMEHHGVKGPAEGGWLRWGEDLSKTHPAEKRHINALVRTAHGVFFGRRRPGPRQIAYAGRLSRRLRRVPVRPGQG